MRNHEPIHGSIVARICKIKASLDAVAKSQKNQHGGYMFASTDDIYAALARRMGEVGLICFTREDDTEIVRIEKDGKTVQWLRATFSFVLATEEATYADEHARRTLFIQITGPQTFQAAQSYAEKAFLRSLFKLPTGDMDLDSMPQADTEDAQMTLVQPKKRKSSSAAKRDGTDKTFNQIVADIRGSLNAEHLQHLKETYADEWSDAPARWAELLDQEYEDKMESFGAREAAE